MSFISSYCHLDNETCKVNGKVLVTRDHQSADSWYKQLYKDQELVYPKFYKMDALSQAGFLASEMIKRACPSMTEKYKDDEIAMLFANQTSSVESDLKFKRSYKELGAPSPALFVYTLPNIVLGELAILNKWYGENMFAVLPKFTPEFFVDYINILMSTGSEAVLCGWLGVSDNEMEVFLFLVEKDGAPETVLSTDHLSKISGL